MVVLGCVVLERAFVNMTTVPAEESDYSTTVAAGIKCDGLACTHPSWLKKRGSNKDSSPGGGGTDADAIPAGRASAPVQCKLQPNLRAR